MTDIEKAIAAIKISLEGEVAFECDNDTKFYPVIDLALNTALSALREQAERDNPKPLTLDELRRMKGEPVYIFYPKAPEYGRWGIIEGVSVGGAVIFWRDYSLYDYGKTWFAYRHKPKEVQP